MSIPLSTVLAKHIRLSSGKGTLPIDAFISNENGKVLGFTVKCGFLLCEDIIITEGSWEHRGKPEKNKSGDNWRKFRIQNRKGSPRGKVTEIWIDPISFSVTKIEGTTSLFGYFPKKRIYSAEDIFEVIPSKKTIVVEEENRVFQKKEVFSICP